jgi:hypothetical protein
MAGIWKVLNSIIVIALAVWFVKWYVKGHFGKYFILFWTNTIIALIMYLSNPGYNKNWPQHDNRTGAEVWEQQYGKVN